MLERFKVAMLTKIVVKMTRAVRMLQIPFQKMAQ